jgi:hypothetical protein
MLPGSMTGHAAERPQMRILAAVLTMLWAATAVAVAAAYRPGGPLDIAVALACFGPVLVASVGLVWPPAGGSHVHRAALAWTWIGAFLLAIPILYGVASTLAGGGPQTLVPSAEAAYAGLLAVFVMAVFSLTGFAHGRGGGLAFERRATLLALGLASALTIITGAAFGLVAIINDHALRDVGPGRSAFGPSGAELVPPLCDEPVALGPYARVTIEARSSLDERTRGRATLSGQRVGIDETWSGTWSGPDGEGRSAYLRIGREAWLNDGSADPAAPGSTWRATRPDPFELAGEESLTMDGPPHAIVAVPRGAIVAEDLGVEVVEGAPARHCRTFVDGPTALASFLPLRWLLTGGQEPGPGDARLWRGELDWWVFGDGELGRARVEVSGSRADTPWAATGVRAALEADLSATERDRTVDITRAVLTAPGIGSRPLVASPVPSPAGP